MVSAWLAVGCPLGGGVWGLDEVSVGDVEFEHTVPAIQVRLGAGGTVGVRMVLLLHPHMHKHATHTHIHTDPHILYTRHQK